MKIALLGPLDHFGGGPRVVLELYKIFKENHQVDIITDFYKKENTYSEFEKIPIKNLDYKFRDISFVRRFAVVKGWRDLDLSDYDFVISTHPYSHLTAIKNKNVLVYIISLRTVFQSYRWSGYSGILKFIDYTINLPVKQLEKFSIRNAGCVATLSLYCKNKAEKYYGISPEVIPLGVSLSQFNSDKTENYCVYVGRLSPEKRIDLIIRAWDYAQKDIRLFIVGAGKKAHIDYLKSLAKGKNIEFLGAYEKEQLKNIYSKCLCGIYVSSEEDFGMVPLEFMASGKPVIVANEGGLVEIVRDNIDGFVIDPKPEIISEKVNFLNRNRDIAEKMGKNGNQRAKEFDWNILAEKLLNLAKEKILNK